MIRKRIKDNMINYDKFLSPRITSIPKSGIRRFFDIAAEMKDVISLTVGEPDFVTPLHIREAAIDALKQGKTKYTSNSGIVEFRKEISKYICRRFGVKYDPLNEIIVTVGGSEAIDLCSRAILSPGDEAVIVSPSYVSYAPIVSMIGATPVMIETRMEDEFKLKAEDLIKAITPRTKLLVLPFPSNPTGAIMTKEDLIPIAEICVKSDILVLSDEIYGELTYSGTHTSIASLPGMRERTIIVNGFSKTYAMTGWRLGYACAPEPIMTQMLKIHQYAIMCAPTTSQHAGIKALRDGDADIEYMKHEYDGRRKIILEGLRSLGIDCFEPLGAFYVFPNIAKFGMSSVEFCEKLLHEENVAIVPGDAFGASGKGFVRLSYAYSVLHIEKAIDKIGAFIKRLSK
ncbi:aminotransferase [Clostridia bacterium]|nr:aminotransferase [Clostridia bacterium]